MVLCSHHPAFALKCYSLQYRTISCLTSQSLPSSWHLVWAGIGQMLVESGTTKKRTSLFGSMKRTTPESSPWRKEETCKECFRDSVTDLTRYTCLIDIKHSSSHFFFIIIMFEHFTSAIRALECLQN